MMHLPVPSSFFENLEYCTRDRRTRFFMLISLGDDDDDDEVKSK
jgi:hypothetical protein